jgi:separase
MCLFAGSAEQQTDGSNYLLSLPIPPEPPQDDITLSLVSNYLINAIIILSHYATNTSRSSTAQPGLPFHSFCSSLVSTSTLLTWMPSLSTLSAKHLDSILTKGYSVINKLAQSNSKEAPETLFRIRTYAIKCLAYTSQGTISPDSLWNQTTKFSAEYIKTQISNKSTSESESARVVLASYSDIISVTEKRADRNVMMSGQGFLHFCESWTSFANRVSASFNYRHFLLMLSTFQAGDLESLDKTGALTHSATMPTLATRQLSDTPTTRDVHSEGARPSDVEITSIYTNLARISTALGQENGKIDGMASSRLSII